MFRHRDAVTQRAIKADMRAVFQQPVDRDRGVRSFVVECEAVAVAGDVACHLRQPVDLRHLHCRQRVLDEHRVYAEQHPQRPGGDVVRRFRWRVRRPPHFGIRLLLEHVLCVAREHLRHRDHERAGAIGRAVRLERRVRPVDLDAAHMELVDEMRGFAHVVLALDRHQNRGQRAFLSVLDRLPVHFVDLPQDRLPAIGCRSRAAPSSRSARSRRCREGSNGRPSRDADTRCAS